LDLDFKLVPRKPIAVVSLLTAFLLWPFGALSVRAFSEVQTVAVSQGFNSELVGNVSFPASSGGYARQRRGSLFNLGLTTASEMLLTVRATGSDPWAVALRDFWFQFDTDTASFRYRLAETAEIYATRDVLALFQALADGKPSAPASLELGLYQRTLAVETLEAQVPVVDEGRLRIWLNGGLIAPRRMETLTAVGHGFVSDADEPPFYLDFVSAEANRGFGWSLGAGARYEANEFSVSLNVSNLLSELHWPKAHVRRALANNRTKITGPDGYPSLAPLVQGRYSVEPWTDSLPPRWEVRYETKTPRRLSAIHLSGSEHVTRLHFHWLLNPAKRVSVGVSWPGPAVHAGVEWGSWFLGVGAAKWPPFESPAFRIEFGRRWR